MDSNITEVIVFLEGLLGKSTLKNKNNYAFKCPFCNHYKKKLEIQPTTQYWNCWVCGVKGKSLFTLLRKLSVGKQYYSILKNLIPKDQTTNIKVYEDSVEIPLNLPKEYIPLWQPNNKNFFWKKCITYLKKRGVTYEDILKYKIGYAIDGKYSNMIIFPNYNKTGKLTYFTTRAFLENNLYKFVNPIASKNIIGFELQINFDLPIILVESALDAIVIKRNAIPLYGTIVPDILKFSILENEVKKLYIALDEDALKKQINIAKYFINNGVDVYFVKLPKNKDPNDLGFSNMWNLINSTEKITTDELFELEIKSML